MKSYWKFEKSRKYWVFCNTLFKTNLNVSCFKFVNKSNHYQFIEVKLYNIEYIEVMLNNVELASQKVEILISI